MKVRANIKRKHTIVKKSKKSKKESKHKLMKKWKGKIKRWALSMFSFHASVLFIFFPLRQLGVNIRPKVKTKQNSSNKFSREFNLI